MAKDKTTANKQWLKTLGRVTSAALVYSAVIVINQDLLIFPGAVKSLFSKSDSNPPEVVEHFLETRDGRQINIWALPPPPSLGEKRKVAVIFHGNGGDIRTFFHFQKWFQSQGYASYDFDYPGYGKSTGWMSEKRIYQDAETVIKFVSALEKIPANEIVILGISIGSGPAAYTAQLYQSKTLLISSGYSSIPEVVKTRFLLGYLTPFVRYNFPTARYLEKLVNGCVIISHGRKDNVIQYDNSLRLKEAATKSNKVTLITSELGSHNDTFWEKSEELKAALKNCAY